MNASHSFLPTYLLVPITRQAQASPGRQAGKPRQASPGRQAQAGKPRQAGRQEGRRAIPPRLYCSCCRVCCCSALPFLALDLRQQGEVVRKDPRCQPPNHRLRPAVICRKPADCTAEVEQRPLVCR
jgi:hypothetical protein